MSGFTKLLEKVEKLDTIMTNASIKNSLFVLSSVAIAAILSLGAFATIAHAQEDYNYGWGTGGDGADYNYGWGTGGDGSDYNYGWGTGGANYADDVPSGPNYLDDVPANYLDDVGLQYSPDCGCYEQYINEKGVVYTERSYDSFGSSGSQFASASMPSFSMPSFGRAPSTSYAPSYPSYQAPAPQRPVQQQQQQQQQQGGGQPINIVNTNTNTNTNTNVNT